MSSLVNRVQVVGNLGADPEVRYTQDGTPVANFRLATNEAWNDKNGEKQKHTEWHRIVAWGKLAETCGKYLAKGAQVIAEGRLRTREWTDRDGNKRYTTEIHVDQVQFLNTRKGNTASQNTSASEEEAPMVDEPEGQEVENLDVPF